ncbi:MAG: D-alanine--D-alanine ligase [Nitrospirae bacterium]|nr:D-alanine--D-alanine ligase [Candidatus Troglogloeales bacterium]
MIGKKIGVLMGGISAEREISLKSGAAVAESLIRQGYIVCPIDVNPEIALTLRQENVDVAFIALHGRHGEDGIIQGLLEMMQIPYTGSGVLASALGMDKAQSRKLFIASGLATPASLLLIETEKSIFKTEPLPFGYPAVVKPISEGSSVGVTIVEGPDGMAAALNEAFRFGPKILVEQYIAGYEVHVGILDQAALGAIEIRPQTSFYDYTAKYVKGMSEHIFPAKLPPNIYQEMLALGLKAHLALGCSGYSRADFILDRAYKPYLLEVNTLPGMTETSLLPEIARGVGISFDQLVEKILTTASFGK